ncbi:uncharacterized protein LOC111291096 isoform X1 [Durio zibethinus]|uniref:Uncharacterized protein LOC111291096 isoform X1 n=1 Tax=Durio zibethinus TaxID=66656 RepID=A0A6P5YD53_DURZI|nr:uncharacterized protein LOC111291096 isoform X1 [Durio zibethinus]
MVACVLMFNLQQDDFPVDTHVFEIARAIGWVPTIADKNKTYLHLNLRIPNELKFDLNCLLYTHGKLCRKCTMKGSSQKKLAPNDNSCPLRDYCKNSSMNKINCWNSCYKMVTFRSQSHSTTGVTICRYCVYIEACRYFWDTTGLEVCAVLMGKEQLRLFGFELSFHEGHENCLGESEEVNDSRKSSEKIVSQMGKTVKEKSVTRKLEKRKYECQFCLKKFTNSQALGGRQNGHKSEKLKKRRMQLQTKSTNLSFTDEPSQDHSDVCQHCSLPSPNCFSCVPEFTLFKEFLVNFKSLDQSQNLYCNMAESCHSFPLPSYDHIEEGACGRHIVIKRSPSYISKDCQSLYNQLGLAPPAIHSSSRNGNDRSF